MRAMLIEAGARRWGLRVALLAGLTALLVGLAPSITAQDNPRPPHWFWGTDLDSYVGDQVVAINQDGDQVGSSTVDSEGGWTVTVSPEDARTVTLQLITDSETRATDTLDVVDGGFDPDGLSITDFRHRISEELGGSKTPRSQMRYLSPGCTQPDDRARDRVRDCASPDGVPVYPAPTGSLLPTGRSLQPYSLVLRSSLIRLRRTASKGRIIARYVEADGRRHANSASGSRATRTSFPRSPLLSRDRTGPDWARSNLLDLPLPGNDSDPSRSVWHEIVGSPMQTVDTASSASQTCHIVSSAPLRSGLFRFTDSRLLAFLGCWPGGRMSTGRD